MPCQGCGSTAPTRYFRFHQHIGALIMMFNRWIKGNFCRACALGYFKKYTFITLFCGWWGIVSFFLAPIFLLMNLFYGLRALGMEKAPAGLTQPPPLPDRMT